MEVTLEVPEGYFDGADAAELGRRLKLYAAILLFHDGSLSAGAAATLAGVDRITFLSEAAAHGVPAVAYPASELAGDVAHLQAAPS